MNKKAHVVVIGGGTGTYAVLSGLKKYGFDITAIVSMADSGGVAKVERDEFGILPNSDVRKALLALSEPKGEDILRKLFSYRFYKGVGIRGITFGNFFLTALTDILGSQVEAIKAAEKILNVKGRVLPVSLEQTNLFAQYEDGSKVLGENYIDSPVKDGTKRISNLSLVPEIKVYTEAENAIKGADMIIIGPGDLFTSIIANLVVTGVSEAIKESNAVKVYIVNLIAKFGETYRYTAKDHVKEIEKYLGKNVIDYVVVNKAEFPKSILKKYRKEKGYPVKDDLKDSNFKVIRGNFIAKGIVEKQKGDSLRRSLVRHDSYRLAKAISKLLMPQNIYGDVQRIYNSSRG